jgi:hypothetical protein
MVPRFDAQTVFMLAPQRHGSNKTQALLGSHHRSMFGPFPPVLRQRFLALEPLLGDTLLDAMVANANLSPRPFSQVRERPITGEEVRVLMDARGLPSTVLGVMSALYRAGAIRGGCEDARVLCKSPDNLEIFGEIIASIGDAAFIHVVRDPRGVWNSSRGTPRGSQTPYLAARAWSEYHGKVASLMEEHPIHSLRFEDLLNQTEVELRRACAFLEVPFDMAMVNAHETPEARQAAKASKELWGNLSSPIKSARASAWERELPAEEVEIIEAACGDLMGHFGYARTQAPRSAKQVDIDYSPALPSADPTADPRCKQLSHLQELYTLHGLEW